MPALKITRGFNAGQTFDLGNHEVIIGRESDCEVRLPGRAISRQHARIVHENDHHFIEDLGSVNGTYVNGDLVERRRQLADHDQIRLHECVLVFFCETASENGVGSEVDDSSHDSKTRYVVNDVQATTHGLLSDRSESKKVRALLQLTRDIGSTLDLLEMLHNILDSLFVIFPQSKKGYILQGDEEQSLSPTAIKHAAGVSDTISPISSQVAQEVMRQGSAFLSGDLLTEQSLREMRESIFEESIRSIMCAPLMGPSHRAMGVIQLEADDPQQPFREEDLEILVTVALLAGMAVEFSRFHEIELELNKRRNDMRMAKEVQLQFIPTRPPQQRNYRFYQYYKAAREVAGDYLDYIPLPQGKLGIAFGDVAGKGPSAALFMARISAEVRNCLMRTSDLTQAMRELNELVLDLHAASFMTLVLAELDPETHRLTIVNAGHPPPYIRRRKNVVEPVFSGEYCMPIGIESGVQYMQHTVELEIGEVVLWFTDGVSDALDELGEPYGTERIEQVLGRSAPIPQVVGQALLADVRRYAGHQPQTDDICLFALSRGRTGSSHPGAPNRGDD